MDSVASVAVPDQCRLCDLPLTAISRVPVCGPCLGAIEGLDVSVACVRCGLPFEDAAALHSVDLCAVCRTDPWPFYLARSFGVYEGDLRRLIHLLKYDRMVPLAAHLAGRMAGLTETLAPADMMVAVPLYRLRSWRRGFNQAHALARELSRRSGVKLASRLLTRVRATKPQAGLSHQERRRNVDGAFAVRRKAEVRGKRVILVDDVMTTGATLGACAKVLKAAGAESVAALTVARAKRRITPWKLSDKPRPRDSESDQASHTKSGQAGEGRS